MVAIKDFALGRTEMIKVDPRRLTVEEGYNSRVASPEGEQAHLELKANISANGVTEPLKAELVGDQFIVRNGHRRLRAVMELIGEGIEFASVPVIPLKAMTEEERIDILYTSNQVLALSPIEKGMIFQRYISLGWTAAKIGDKYGLSYKQVENLLLLTRQDADILEMVAEGKVSATTVIETVKAEGKTAATEAIREVAATGKKVTDKTLREAKPAPVPPAAPPASITATPGALGALLGIKGPPAAPAALALPPPPDMDEDGNIFPRLIQTERNFKILYETVRECLNVTDIKQIHAMCGEAVSIQRPKKVA